MRRRGESWPTVLVSEVGNGLDPNETFSPRKRPERASSSKKPVSANGLVEKDSIEAVAETEQSAAALVLGCESNQFVALRETAVWGEED